MADSSNFIMRVTLVPVSSHLSWKTTAGHQNLHDASCERNTVQSAVLLWNGYINVDQRVLLNNVVCFVVIVGLLQLVCFFPKQRWSHICNSSPSSPADQGSSIPLAGPAQTAWLAAQNPNRLDSSSTVQLRRTKERPHWNWLLSSAGPARTPRWKIYHD